MAATVDRTTLESRFEEARRAHSGTIRTFAWNCVQQLPGMDIDDITQELLIVLWRCVQNYDPNRGASFSTLFQGSARNHVIGLVRHSNVQKRGKGRTVTLDDEAFTRAVETMHLDGSAEDWYIALAEHGERFSAELALSVA